jgi:hypothetical protein
MLMIVLHTDIDHVLRTLQSDLLSGLGQNPECRPTQSVDAEA